MCTSAVRSAQKGQPGPLKSPLGLLIDLEARKPCPLADLTHQWESQAMLVIFYCDKIYRMQNLPTFKCTVLGIKHIPAAVEPSSPPPGHPFGLPTSFHPTLPSPICSSCPYKLGSASPDGPSLSAQGPCWGIEPAL